LKNGITSLSGGSFDAKRKKVLMISRNQKKTILAIFLCAFFLGQSCTANPVTVAFQSQPTATSTVTFYSPSPTKSVTSTPNATATLDAIQTASIQTLISTVQPVVLAEYPSIDRKWQVDIIRYDCINYTNQDYKAIIAYEQLKLINLSDGTEKFVDEQPQACDGIGMYGLGGLYWSPSNRYFYYTHSREGNPETCGNYAVPTIYRLDTLTQETMMVGGGHLSPDKTKLAMWEWQEHEIIIWDLDQGEVGRVPGLIPDTLDGDISWSPDSQSLVYLQTTFDCAPDYGKVYFSRLNLPEISQSLLFEHESPGFGSVSWNMMDQLTLRDGNNNQWKYRLASKELKIAP
jgi:hypothetical protein